MVQPVPASHLDMYRGYALDQDVPHGQVPMGQPLCHQLAHGGHQLLADGQPCVVCQGGSLGAQDGVKGTQGQQFHDQVLVADPVGGPSAGRERERGRGRRVLHEIRTDARATRCLHTGVPL